ncbi:Hypothetical_protein [Hexamita inflata]|uniref:Hypothetical_protein n=1 Tax=Hexamita inflata TaxID=28002 RepID=A0AA86U0M3_9EUKA|nr:Hypothetical protein HINF_LOCUS14628 [Hexamita inflata]
MKNHLMQIMEDGQVAYLFVNKLNFVPFHSGVHFYHITSTFNMLGRQVGKRLGQIFPNEQESNDTNCQKKNIGLWAMQVLQDYQQLFLYDNKKASKRSKFQLCNLSAIDLVINVLEIASSNVSLNEYKFANDLNVDFRMILIQLFC